MPWPLLIMYGETDNNGRSARVKERTMTTTPALPPLFASSAEPVEDEHPLYRACISHRGKQQILERLTRIWMSCGHLHPDDPEWFVGQFRRHFPARAWELYVLDWLVRSGARLDQRPRGGGDSGKGPDFCAFHPHVGRFWIECVVATPGNGANQVWQRTTETSWSGPPDEPLELRYTSSIHDKINKIAGDRRAGIVASNEPVVLALSQGAIRDSDLNDLEFPLAMRVLYGVSGTDETIDPDTGESKLIMRRRKALRKPSGSVVSSWIFGEADSEVIAGLMLARAGTYELFTTQRCLMLMAHNRGAHNKIPIGGLPFRGEVWEDADGRRLVHRGDVAEFEASVFEAEFATDE